MTAHLFLLADGAVRTRFEWGRIQANTDWILPLVVCVAIMLFVRYMYRRDAVELPFALGWILTTLRTLVFYGLLILYLEPQWRIEREVTRNSRVLLVADTSLSMRQADVPSAAGPVSRARRVAEVLDKSDLLNQLRKTHEVVVFRFDQELGRLATLDKLAANQAAANDDASVPPADAAETEKNKPSAEPIAWDKALSPSGTETRLGQALGQLLHDEQNAPVSGVVVFTDGGQNAGPGLDNAIQTARAARIPVYPIGMGSDQQPANVRISDFTAPPRAYPGDRYTVTGYLQAQKMAGRTVTVELFSRAAQASAAGQGQLEAQQQIKLGVDGEVVAVPFELTPEAPGRRTLTLRVQPPPDDQNRDDNQREADVEIVEQKNHVLLMAGGPQREYQFLRNMLFRDKSVVLDVLLQSARSGASQEGNKLLDAFPATKEALFGYDCIVAIDPDWQEMSEAQVLLLEKWVGEQGGGLIVAPGPVHAGKSLGAWLQDAKAAKVRALYPVEFHRTSGFEGGASTSSEPWPIEFTREGLESQFLWLGDTAADSQEAWTAFPGVYSCFPVRGVKPGATVYARYSDPRTIYSGKGLPYFVGQFYGSGRVFYQGSAEMWRIRRVEEGNFEKFYTKLIRHASQGRLLRGSARGVLLVGQDHGYLVGATVDIRAQLSNAQFEPLAARNVTLQVVQPDGANIPVAMMADAGRPGTYTGHFTAVQEGTYRLELPIPESDNQRLVRRVQVKVPDLELENPQRNDALLGNLANATRGKYFVGPDTALPTDPAEGLLGQLKDRTKTIVLTAAPNPEWEQRWLRWLMLSLCGLLCCEWLIRRLAKLA